jgi:hypothetical protein
MGWLPLSGSEMRANESGNEGGLLRAEVVTYDDAPDECTIFPEDVSEEQRTTAWITARGGSFCRVSSQE